MKEQWLNRGAESWYDRKGADAWGGGVGRLKKTNGIGGPMCRRSEGAGRWDWMLKRRVAVRDMCLV